ncbi:UNVERIFIED_CONTAM: OHCU decarboxylase [Euhalothece sp. KZN 001]
MKYSLKTLNEMEKASFTEVLGHIFEESPDITADTWEKRPFTDLDDLHQKLVTTARSRSPTEQIALIKKHPDLATKTKMADASVQEQTTVGLNALTEEEYHRFQELNQAYRAKFGFPFIIAVRNHDKESILQAFVTRLENSLEEEKERAIAEISKIAYFRLLDVVE